MVWLSRSRVSDALERVLERRDLPAERRDLLVEELDLGQRPLADLVLVLELGGELRDPVAGRIRRVRLAVEEAAQPVALGLGGRKAGLQGGEVVGHLAGARPFQRQQFGEFRDLGVEAVQHRVLGR